MRPAGEATAFGIRKSKALTAEALLQQPIFLLEILDRLELPTIDPAGKQRQEKMQRLDGAKHRRQYSGMQLIERIPSSTGTSRPNNWILRVRRGNERHDTSDAGRLDA